MARNKVTLYPDGFGALAGASAGRQNSLAAVGGSGPSSGTFTGPVAATAGVDDQHWSTGADQYDGDSMLWTVGGTVLLLGTDFTMSPGGSGFAVQSIVLGVPATGPVTYSGSKL